MRVSVCSQGKSEGSIMTWHMTWHMRRLARCAKHARAGCPAADYRLQQSKRLQQKKTLCTHLARPEAGREGAAERGAAVTAPRDGGRDVAPDTGRDMPRPMFKSARWCALGAASCAGNVSSCACTASGAPGVHCSPCSCVATSPLVSSSSALPPPAACSCESGVHTRRCDSLCWSEACDCAAC